MKSVYINRSWDDQHELAVAIDAIVKDRELRGFKFKDVKISSSGNGTLILFEKCIRR